MNFRSSQQWRMFKHSSATVGSFYWVLNPGNNIISDAGNDSYQYSIVLEPCNSGCYHQASLSSYFILQPTLEIIKQNRTLLPIFWCHSLLILVHWSLIPSVSLVFSFPLSFPSVFKHVQGFIFVHIKEKKLNLWLPHHLPVFLPVPTCQSQSSFPRRLPILCLHHFGSHLTPQLTTIQFHSLYASRTFITKVIDPLGAEVITLCYKI